MKRLMFCFTATAIFSLIAVTSEAQPERGDSAREGQRRGRLGGGFGGPGGPDRGPGGGPQDRRRGGPPATPVFKALDADNDNQLSVEEIANAVAALKKLDKNKDGKLTSEELRPTSPEGDRGPRGIGRGSRGDRPEGEARPGDSVRRERGSRDGDSPRGQRTSRPDAPPQRRPGADADRGNGRESAIQGFTARLKAYDKNKDGKLTKDEIPERIQGFTARLDTNKDGVLDESELGQAASPERASGRRREGGNSRPGGPPNAEQFIEHALTFDADGDGKLDRDELLKLHGAMQQRRERGGERGPDRARGGRPPGGGRPEGRPDGDRSRRPTRPETDN